MILTKFLSLAALKVVKMTIFWYSQWWKFNLNDISISVLTLKHQEMHGCVVSTVATNALVLKHQAISIHNAD